MRKKRLLALLGSICLVLVLAALPFMTACPAPPAEEEGPTPTLQPKNLLVVASTDSVTTWDPSAAFSTESSYLPNVYEGLLRATPPGSDQDFEPLLATDWEASSDGLSWAFYLREGVKFHDGEVFNAQAVKTAIERTMNLGLGAAFIFDPIEEIEVVDKYTVRFKLSYPAPLDRILASANAAWIMSPKSAAQSREWFDAGNEAGTGPYMLESYKPDEEIVFTKFDDYWGGWKDSNIKKVIVKIIKDAVVQRSMLESGEADIVTLIPRDSIEKVGAREDCKVLRGPSFENYACHLNTAVAPLDNKLVRQAISYAIPYQDIVEVGVSNFGRQAVGPVPYGEFGHDENLFQYSYDIDKAEELMKQAGYPDGIDRTLMLTYATENAVEKAYCPLIKEGLSKIGIDVKISPMIWTSQWELVKSGPDDVQDMALLLWWPTFNDPYDTLYSLWHTEGTPFWNFSYYKNSEFDDLINEAYATPDPEKAKELYSEAQAIIVEDAPSVYLFDVESLVPMRSNVFGHEINPAYPRVVFYYNIYKQ